MARNAPAKHSALGPRIKRAFDVTFAGTAMALLAPVMALIALLIKLEDRGPVFYTQTRTGRDGVPFQVIKFRSMVVGAEHIGLGMEVAKDDDRFTRMGKVLRQWRLDEMMQGINVLKGDMSIVGPRATIPSQTDRYTDHQWRRLEMRPGMAGWALVKGGNELPWEERIEHDIWYIDHWSLWLDLFIILKSVYVIARRRGLYDEEGIARDLK